MTIRSTIAIAAILSLLGPEGAIADEDLYGTWQPVAYELTGGGTVPLNGVMIITPNYLVGNTVFDIDGDGKLEANANAGPISVEGGIIKMLQWMQLHWRENDLKDHFLREDVPEDIAYSIEGNELTFHFPSGNRYLSKRLE